MQPKARVHHEQRNARYAQQPCRAAFHRRPGGVAIEARRVLQAVDAVADGMPQVDRALTGAIDVRRQWWDCPDTAAEVLMQVYERIGALADLAADTDR